MTLAGGCAPEAGTLPSVTMSHFFLDYDLPNDSLLFVLFHLNRTDIA